MSDGVGQSTVSAVGQSVGRLFRKLRGEATRGDRDGVSIRSAVDRRLAVDKRRVRRAVDRQRGTDGVEYGRLGVETVGVWRQRGLREHGHDGVGQSGVSIRRHGRAASWTAWGSRSGFGIGATADPVRT